MKINDAIWDELEAENKRLKHVIWMQRNECGLLNTSLTQAEAALAERGRILRRVYDDLPGARPLFVDWYADLRARAEEGSGTD